MPSAGKYRSLDAASVKETVLRLENRIAARFPERGLRAVAGELVTLVDETIQTLQRQRRSMHLARLASLAVVVALVLAVGFAVWWLVSSTQGGIGDPLNWPGFFESLINDLVFAGIAIYFTWLWPQRIYQRSTLRALDELRSLAHVIDMHQLTKDPERLRPDFVPTQASFEADLSAPQLSYYLDYCSELMSCVGKTAALYAWNSTDGAVLNAIGGIEDLTTGMSRKIWQKIALLPQHR